GLRNNSVIRLLSEFRLHGLSLEKSRELILAWNEKNKIGLLQRELEHVLHSAYAHPLALVQRGGGGKRSHQEADDSLECVPSQ
ncbi:MAG: primase C-terminal domain-containing protein, partial [Chlamydiae bacterium]|nr:primase C-terminal domain-containing protein [Chlamydiota bacterium]